MKQLDKLEFDKEVPRMGFVELFEIGFITVFWDFSTPILSISAYLCLFFGSVIQLSFLEKIYNRIWRLSLLEISVIGIVICECVWHTITGWDRFIVDWVYLLFVSVFLGSGITTLIYHFHKKKKEILDNKSSQ